MVADIITYVTMGATPMWLEHTVPLLGTSPSRRSRGGSASLRPRMRRLALPNAVGSTGSGHGSSTGSTGSALCSATSAVAQCGSSPPPSSRVPSARAWLTQQPEEASWAARRSQVGGPRAPWPPEVPRQRSASWMAQLYMDQPSLRKVRPDQATFGPRSSASGHGQAPESAPGPKAIAPKHSPVPQVAELLACLPSACSGCRLESSPALHFGDIPSHK